MYISQASLTASQLLIASWCSPEISLKTGYRVSTLHETHSNYIVKKASAYRLAID